MAEKILAATKVDIEIKRRTTVPMMLHDGGGLYLQRARSGSVSWIFRYRSPVTHKGRDMGLGAARKTTLADVRVEADRLRKLVKTGKDPIIERDKAGKSGQTFRQAFELMEKRNGENPGWRRMLELHAFPKIGDKLIADLAERSCTDFADIIAALERVGKRETGHKLQNRMNRVMEDATDSNDTPANRKRICRKVPSFKKGRKNKHHKSLDFAAVPTFVRDIRALPQIAARALEFVILTVCRTGDVIGARDKRKREVKPPLRWPDIDLKRKVWTVPAIKTADDHNPEPFEIPLCDAAIDVLLRMETMKKAMKLDTDIVFPMVRPNGRCEPMTRGAMRELIAHEQCSFTVHGMRTSFRTWAGEKTSAQRDLIETVLAHKVFSEDKAEAAYKSKTTFFERRRDLMRRWGEFATANKIVPLKKAA